VGTVGRASRGAIAALCLVVAIGFAISWLTSDTKGRTVAASPSVQSSVYLPIVFQSYRQLPFIDDFSDPTSGWPISQSGFSQKGYVTGQYWMKVLQPNYEAYAGNSLYTLGDVQLEVSAYSDTPTIAAYGLFFAYSGVPGQSGETSLYDFQINPGTGQFELVRQVYDTNTPTPNTPPTIIKIIDWTSSSAILTGSQTNSLKVIRSGTTITLYVNGQQLDSPPVTDATLGAGTVGMDVYGYAANAEAFFDNFAFVDNTTTPLP
jgi:hypothetical protein